MKRIFYTMHSFSKGKTLAHFLSLFDEVFSLEKEVVNVLSKRDLRVLEIILCKKLLLHIKDTFWHFVFLDSGVSFDDCIERLIIDEGDNFFRVSIFISKPVSVS